MCLSSNIENSKREMSDTVGRWSRTDSQGKWVFTLTFTKVPKNLRLKLQRS